ncbi:sensor histidine kinase [Paenibacillus puldeungensis]|uniref:histidine kinase n=1 Tax=Paenibacillus puldeungensis TaxID=696536 RepID=A0ABW3RXH2_9BACL
MIWILFGVCIVASILGVRLFRLKRQLHDITSQLDERTSEKTEKKVTVALIDNDLNELATAINRNLDLQKKLRIDVRSNDLQLKDSIANLSHDLRTPLTSILGYLQLSRNPECPPEKREEYLNTVNDKAHSLKFMINSLYELSVLDVKETPLSKEKLDLNLLLSDILADQYELFQKLGIILDINLPDHPVWITGDRIACTRIIQNLLNNSSRYARGNVRIRMEASGSYAFLSISNPAPNLKQEDIKRLFERFYTADKSRTSGSSGLGLYIVKTLLKKMNGKVADVSLEDHILNIKVGFLLDLH